MSGTADIVRALGGPRLVPARSPGQLRALVRAGLPYASLAALAAGFRLEAPATPSRSSGSPSARSRAARRRGASRPRSPTGWSGSPASPRSPRTSSGAARRRRAGSLRKTAASAGARRSPSSTRTSARKRSRRSSCAWPTASSADGGPVRVWRLCKKAHAAFDGEGARRAGGRWNRRGTAVVYASQTLSLAALELLVHADPVLLPDDLVAVPAEVPEALAIESVDAGALPRDWRRTPCSRRRSPTWGPRGRARAATRRRSRSRPRSSLASATSC